MSRVFSMVSPKLWLSRRFRGLITDSAKLFYLYVLTCQHQTSAGCFKLPDAYVMADLGWSAEKLSNARAPVVEAGLLLHDPETDEYFVPRWFRHNPGKNPNHRKGIVRLISELESDLIRQVAKQEYDEYHEDDGNPPGAPGTSNGNRRHLGTTGYMSGKRGWQ